MVFGSADLCGIPWEMIIKQFRKYLGSECFDTVEQYSESFWEFLCESENIIPMDIRENYLIDTYRSRFFPSLVKYIEENRIKEIIDKDGVRPSISETYRIIEEESNSLLQDLSEQVFFEGFNEDDITAVSGFSLEVARSVCDDNLFQEEGEAIPESLYKVIGDLFATITCKKSQFGRNTGLVFAGYGEKEFMPAVLAFDVLGFYQRKLRFSPNLDKSSSGGLCAVKAYAQEEEVETFLHGISKNLKGFMMAGFAVENGNLLEDVKEKIKTLSLPEHEREAFIEDFERKLEERYSAYSSVIDSQINHKFTSKVTEMIEFLPKQDLAYMAESLVNLTAFKRKVSNDNETVGGPIDVAIISKGDGFIWVKRKHYFDKDLNHHYFSKLS
ncbi:hypothetical protein [Serratia marcescens]|uniref:hypothetical protein n=1 Tax=Serratia marcescens TaxID=615 RepID=UPI000A4DA355|nr:hypothetical protein [Serratia marcescens]